MTAQTNNNFFVLLEVMARRSRFIMMFVLSTTLIAIIVSLVLPKWYKATALLLPPKEITVPVGNLSNYAEAVSVTRGLDLPIMVTPSDVYARILKSRTIAEPVIEKFRLYQRYETTTFDETYEELLDNTDFRVTAEGLLSVSAEDKDPKVAADMANAFVEELDRVNRDIASQRAKHNLDFVEDRLIEVRGDLDSARSKFENFQTENKAVDFDQQTRLVTERAVQLKVKQAEIDLELELAKQELASNNPRVIELERKRKIVSGQLVSLETENPDNSYFSVPISKIPTLRGQYEMLYSQVQVNERLYEILLEQREQAKIQLSENSPTISVLDPARAPSLRSRPQRTLIVVATFGFALVISVLVASAAEYLRRLKENNPDEYRPVEMFIRSFFGWLPGIKK